MDKEISCLACRYFSPGENHGSPTWEYEEHINATNSPQGVCRFNPPQVGSTFTGDDDETMHDFGQWPRVLCSDWCGRFEGRDTE